MEPAQTADELEELRAYNEAMEMNRQLKEMLEQSEAPPQQQSRAPLRQHQPQARTRAPAQARKRAAAPAAAAAAAAGGRNFTFSDQKLNTMGRENQVLLERMQRIALSSGTGLSSKPAAASYRQKVGSNGINRQKKDRKVQSENMAFLKRLQSVKPTISRSKLKSDARKNKQLSRQIQVVKYKPRFEQNSAWEG